VQENLLFMVLMSSPTSSRGVMAAHLLGSQTTRVPLPVEELFFKIILENKPESSGLQASVLPLHGWGTG